MIYQKDLKQPFVCFEEIQNKKFSDFTKVKQVIQQLTEEECGKNKNIVDKAIVMYVYSSNCPDLTFIDLPGLISIQVESQAQNSYEITKNIIQKYILDQNTIILCVIPANQDVTKDETLHMARQIDHKGQRTIGCLTKIDIMVENTDVRTDLMNKGEIPLKLGYVGIRNRSQADINQNRTVKQSLEDEKIFFAASPVYSSLPSNFFGTSSLLQKISKSFQRCIANNLPTLLDKIKEKKYALSQKIKTYGRPWLNDILHKERLVGQVCNDYILRYKNAIKKFPSAYCSSQRIKKVSNNIQESLQNFLLKESIVDLETELTDKKILFALKKFDSVDNLDFPSISAFLYLLNPILNDLKISMEISLNQLCDQLNHLAELIAVEVTCQYKQLKQLIVETNTEIVNDFRRKANQFLNYMLECEINGVTYRQLDFDKKINQTKQSQLDIGYPLIPILREIIIKYYQRSVYNLRELIPKNISYLLLSEATKKIEFEIFHACVGSEEKTEKLLKQDGDSVQQIIAYEKELDLILKTEQHILAYQGFSAVRSTIKKKKREELRQKKTREANELKLQKEEEEKQFKRLQQEIKLKEEKEQQIKLQEIRKQKLTIKKQSIQKQKQYQKYIQEQFISRIKTQNSETNQKKQKVIKQENLKFQKKNLIDKSKANQHKIKVQAKIWTETDSENNNQKKSQFTFRDKNVSKVWEEIQKIEQKSPQIAHLICDQVMNETPTETQIKNSQNVKKSLKEKALQNPESVENMVSKLADELQKSGISIIMSEHSTAQSQISLKILTEGFMQSIVKVSETIPDNDPDCPFVFEDLEDPQQFQNFSSYYKNKISKETGLDPAHVFISCVTKGSIQVEWTTDDSEKLIDIIQTQPLLEKKLKIHKFFQFFHLSPEDFDTRGNIQFNDSKNSIETRGGWPYYQPIKCKRYGLNVSRKYDNGNDLWIGMNGQKGEWAVAFHGVKAPKSFCLAGKMVLNAIMDGREQNKMLQGFERQAFQNMFALNRVNEHVDFGIYCTPHIQETFNWYTSSSDEYALVFQCRVNPKKIKVCNNNVYWVINETKDIRPYGIILVKQEVKKQYPTVQQQYTQGNQRGKQFDYKDFKESIQKHINSY